MCAQGEEKGNFFSSSKFPHQGIRAQNRGSTKHPLHLFLRLFHSSSGNVPACKASLGDPRQGHLVSPPPGGGPQLSQARLPWRAFRGGLRLLQLPAIWQRAQGRVLTGCSFVTEGSQVLLGGARPGQSPMSQTSGRSLWLSNAWDV